MKSNTSSNIKKTKKKTKSNYYYLQNSEQSELNNQSKISKIDNSNNYYFKNSFQNEVNNNTNEVRQLKQDIAEEIANGKGKIKVKKPSQMIQDESDYSNECFKIDQKDAFIKQLNKKEKIFKNNLNTNPDVTVASDYNYNDTCNNNPKLSQVSQY